MPGTLFLVATPIGNLSDITYRAVDTLRQVSRIAAEDTRQSRKLLDHFGISTPLTSCHEHNEAQRTPELIASLVRGESIALVSDAGTPLISDPGYRLVQAALAEGIPVVPIPGPSAVITALAASGLASHAFRFVGFLPAKTAARRSFLETLRGSEETTVCYEAPHRLLDTLADLASCVEPDRPVVVARELTKVHEEFLRGTATGLRAELESRPAIKGEITLLIGPAVARRSEAAPEELRRDVQASVAAGLTKSEAIKKVARSHRLPRRELYKLMEER